MARKRKTGNGKISYIGIIVLVLIVLSLFATRRTPSSSETLEPTSTADVPARNLILAETLPEEKHSKPTLQLTPEPSLESAPEPTPEIHSYVLNMNTMKFHRPTCNSVKDMSAKNRKDVEMTREAVIAEGYSPCSLCNP